MLGSRRLLVIDQAPEPFEDLLSRHPGQQACEELRRADALRNDERILEAAKQLLEQSPSATPSDIASAAGVSRSTLYRRSTGASQTAISSSRSRGSTAHRRGAGRLYVLDIDGSHLLHMAGSKRLGEEPRAPFAIGPELDADAIATLRHDLVGFRRVELFALWLRGRAIGVLIAFGRPREPLTASMARARQDWGRMDWPKRRSARSESRQPTPCARCTGR
jgi:AraC-like DNA-binding protein